MPKVKALTGFRYPKSKKVLDSILAGEATSADVDKWVRVKKGGVATVPDHVIPDLNKMGAIEKEA